MEIFNKLNILCKEIYLGWDLENEEKPYSQKAKEFGKHAWEFGKDTFQEWKDIVTDDAKRKEILEDLAQYIPDKQERQEYYDKIKDLSKEQLAEIMIYFEDEIKPELNKLQDQVRQSVVEKWTKLHEDHFNMKDMFDYNRQDARADKLVDWYYKTKDKTTEILQEQKSKISEKMHQLGDKLNKIKQEHRDKKNKSESVETSMSSEEIKIRTQAALLRVAYEYEV